MRNKNAYTLLEMLVVLLIISIVLGCLIPLAKNVMPDKNVLLFKKANQSLALAINEMLNSDKYNYNGDLGKKPNKTLLTDLDANKPYFCNMMAEIIDNESENCSTISNSGTGMIDIDSTDTDELDNYCNATSAKSNEQIKTTDGTVFYEANQSITFGIKNPDGIRYFSDPNSEDKPLYSNSRGLDTAYKVVCIDIDGFDGEEDAFGYGINSQGKIVLGAKAKEWIQKNIQQSDK